MPTYAGQYVNSAIDYDTQTPAEAFDKVRETAAGQVVLYRAADLATFLTNVQASRTDGNASYALVADATNKKVLLRNHADTAWIDLVAFDSSGGYIKNLLRVLSEITAAESKNGGSSSEQAYSTVTIAANDVVVGTTLEVHAFGVITIASGFPPSITFRGRWGGTGGVSLFSLGVGYIGTGTYGFELECRMQVRATGASGSADVRYAGLFPNSGSLEVVSNSTSAVTIDTTAPKTFGLTVQITGGASGDIVRIQQMRFGRVS